MCLPQRGSIHESQGSLGDKLYSVNWPQDQEAAALKEDPMVSRFSSFEAPLGGVAPSPTADNRVLVFYPFFFFFFFGPCVSQEEIYEGLACGMSQYQRALLLACLFLLVLACSCLSRIC